MLLNNELGGYILAIEKWCLDKRVHYNMNDVYNNVCNKISISRHLFDVFIDNLVSIGKITEISKYIK